MMLVIPTSVPLEHYAAAQGLQNSFNGVVMLIIGPFLGKSLFNSFTVLFYLIIFRYDTRYYRKLCQLYYSIKLY